MQRLNGKQILVGITGSIAAYKAAELVRTLSKNGADVRVAMTRAACEFITPLTLQAISGNPVHTQLLDPEAEAGMGHIELARWADVVLVAPASADFMAQLAGGLGDSLLTTLCLATRAPILLAPAMNQVMWQDSATQRNFHILKERGVVFLGPDVGVQACGEEGLGRMLEVHDIERRLTGTFSLNKLSGQRVLITAGPTQEAIDPVRYISNHSSGKMGFALAEAAIELGAKVTLIAGPVHRKTPDRVKRIDVVTAAQMYRVVHEHVKDCDVFISAAAVADYRPNVIAEEKLKKEYIDIEGKPFELTLHCVPTADILASVAELDEAVRPFVTGFAAETSNVVENAMTKLKAKKLDLVVANDVSDTTIGFHSDDNQVTVIGHNFEDSLPKMSKMQTARFLMDLIAKQLKTRKLEQAQPSSSVAETMSTVE